MSDIAPGWEVSPDWTSEWDVFVGGDSARYYYFKKKKPASKPKEADASKVDWSAAAVESEALSREAEKVLAENKRLKGR